MTAVFVGNATKQILQFAYKLPERKQTITQVVPIWSQVQLTIDCSQPDIDAIMEQWGKYGLVNVTEMSHAKDFEGYLISIGRPIASSTLKDATEMRIDVLIERGEEMRANAAIAMINTIEHETGTIAKNYEISVVEEEPRRGFTNPNDRHISEGWRADRSQRPDMPDDRGRRRFG